MSYAQEPFYNDHDAKFLSSLGVEKVNHPAGFELLTSTSFAFCPGGEHNVVFQALARTPAIYLGSNLKDYELGLSCLEMGLTDIETSEESYGPVGTKLDTQTSDVRQNEYATRRSAASVNTPSQMIKRYIKDAQSALLPDYEAADMPFHKQYLYWHESQPRSNWSISTPQPS